MSRSAFFSDEMKRTYRLSMLAQTRFALTNPLVLLAGKIFLSVFNPSMAASLGGFSTLIQYSLLNSAILSILEMLRFLTVTLYPTQEVKVLSPYAVLLLELISAPLIGGFCLNIPVLSLFSAITIGRAICNEFDYLNPIIERNSPFYN